MVRAIVNGVIITEKEELRGKALLFDEKIIGIADENEVIADQKTDAHGMYVCPGLVDVHIHGYWGEDVSDGSEEGVRKMAKGLLENGVTSFLPTTMTVSWNEILQALDTVHKLKPISRREDFEGSEILGVHAEGPFINPKRKGAQAEECILAPDASKVLPHKDLLKIITIAPEMPGGIDFIREVTSQSDIVVSIGHTDASFETAMEAIAAGASHITHLFNAMTGLNHRSPGVVGAALSTDVACELIADTFHIHKGLFSFLHHAKKDKLVLISDCTRAGGLEDGEYTLGGQPIFVKGIECRLKDGTIAGSVLRLNKAVKNLRDHGGVSMVEAVKAASLNAAASIGEESTKGSLAVGKSADIVIMDQECTVDKTFVRGVLKYNKGE